MARGRVVALALSSAAFLLAGLPSATARTPTMGTAAGLTYVNCFKDGRSYQPHPRRHPRACLFQGEPEITANLVIARKLRWRRWGSSTAYATGLQDSNHPGQYPGGNPPATRLSIRLSHRVRGCGGRWYYTRLTFAGYSTYTRLTAGCRAVPAY